MAWAGTATLLLSGCMSGPMRDNPPLLRSNAPVCDNPVFVPLGPTPLVYNVLFEKVLDVITDHGYEIAYSNRYDGRIETFPSVAPGAVSSSNPAARTFINECWRRFRASASGSSW